MDFETAVRIAPQVEQAVPGLSVIGVRRMSHSRPNDSWALDIIEPKTGRMITLDEKDDWEPFLRGIPVETGVAGSVRSGPAQARSSASRPSRRTVSGGKNGRRAAASTA